MGKFWIFFLSLCFAHAHENWVYSPRSVASCLAMLQEGAVGDTFDEIHSVLKHYHYTSLPCDGCTTAQGFWIHEDFPILSTYQKTLQDAYQAEVHSFGVQVAPLVNAWVSEKTHGKIQQLLSPSNSPSEPQLIVTSALYFQGNWLHPFSCNKTKSAPFYSDLSHPTSALFMEQTDYFPFLANESFQALELPLIPFLINNFEFGKEAAQIFCLEQVTIAKGQGRSEDEKFVAEPTRLNSKLFMRNGINSKLFMRNGITCGLTFCLIVPQKEDWILLEEDLPAILSSLIPQKIHISIPKFQIEHAINCKKTLQKLGVQKAFTPLADFSKITGAKNLFLSDVLHKAFFSLNEEGIEAAAASAATMCTTSFDIDPAPSFLANRPFYFCLCDRTSQALLFIGHIQSINPESPLSCN